MNSRELLRMQPPDLYGHLRQNGLNRQMTTLVVELLLELKRLRGERAARPPQPGPLQVRFSPVMIGDVDMIQIDAGLPVAPDPAKLDPDKVPVKQIFKASAGGADIATKEYGMDATAIDPVVADYDTDVVLSVAYADVDGNVGEARTQTVHTPAKAAPPVNLPPDAPGEFGAVSMKEVP